VALLLLGAATAAAAEAEPELIDTRLGTIIGNFDGHADRLRPGDHDPGQVRVEAAAERAQRARAVDPRVARERAPGARGIGPAARAEYQGQLDKAREEAAGIVEKGRQDADAARQRIQDEARQETAEMTPGPSARSSSRRTTAVKGSTTRRPSWSTAVAGR
jgi:hypothetical protein